MGSMIKRGQKVTFEAINDFTGELIILTGTIVGFGKEVRERWPIEMGEAPDDTLLVFRQDRFGNKFYHAVGLEELKN